MNLIRVRSSSKNGSALDQFSIPLFFLPRSPTACVVSYGRVYRHSWLDSRPSRVTRRNILQFYGCLNRDMRGDAGGTGGWTGSFLLLRWDAVPVVYLSPTNLSEPESQTETNWKLASAFSQEMKRRYIEGVEVREEIKVRNIKSIKQNQTSSSFSSSIKAKTER